MNEKQIEEKIRETYASQSPDLWDRILEKLPEQTASVKSFDTKEKEGEGELCREKGAIFMEEKKQSFWKKKWIRIAAGTGAAACLLMVLGFGGAAAMNLLYKGTASSGTFYSGAAADTAAAMDPARGDSDYGWSDQKEDVYEEAEEAADEDYYASENSMATAEMDTMEIPESVQESEKDTAVHGKKLVYTYNLNLETLEFDALKTYVEQQVELLGGYIENQSVNGSSYYYGNTRTADLTIRIPNGKAEGFLNQLGQMGTIRFSSSSAEDITLNYVDTQSRLEALRTEQARLMELMEQAVTTSDLLEIERYLTDVRYEIQSCESRIRTMDNQVSYDTVYLNINEVSKITPAEEPSFMDRIKNGFAENLEAVGEFFQNTVIFLITAIPYLIILIPAGVLLRLLTGWIRRKRKQK